MSYNPNPDAFNHPNTSYNPHGQQQRPGGYQVSSGQSYFPNNPHSRSPSPPSHPPTYNSYSSQQHRDIESQRGGYGVPPANAPAGRNPGRPSPRPLPAPPMASGAPYDRRGPPEPSADQDYGYNSHSPQPPATSYSSRSQLSAAPSNPFLSAQDNQPSPYSSRGPSPVREFDGNTPNRPGALGTIDPMEIEDDDDEPFSSLNSRNRKSGAIGAAVGAGVGMIRGLGSRDPSGQYGEVPGGKTGATGSAAEKSEWLNHQTSNKKRTKWLVTGLIVLVIVLAVVGGVLGVVLSNKSSSSSSDDDPNININSPSIQAMLNNPDLHKVFYGLDYTPLNTQYPACETKPAKQADVTKDIANLSQLTPRIRLYGTDCNQTEMVLQAIENLDLQGKMKVWMGIYLDDNPTTNHRQCDQAYEILEKWGTDPFEGVIVGNEVVFEGWMTTELLIKKIREVHRRLVNKGFDLPVATSALGSNWTDTLAESVDVVMANVHAFFGGLPYQDAASWTWTYWTEHDIFSSSQRNVISEMGWPSQGGHDEGAVAGIAGINTFLSEWVCSALANGTEYFWFEAVDEPWKVKYDTKTDHWEPHWGLFDIHHNLKPGVKIPDCNGEVATL